MMNTKSFFKRNYLNSELKNLPIVFSQYYPRYLGCKIYDKRTFDNYLELLKYDRNKFAIFTEKLFLKMIKSKNIVSNCVSNKKAATNLCNCLIIKCPRGGSNSRPTD